MGDGTDILIIGGPEIAFTTSGAKVRQVPFDFAGLAEAYGLLLEAETVVIVPGPSVFGRLPTDEELKIFAKPRHNDLLTLSLGRQVDNEGYDQRPHQLASELSGLTEVQRPAFILRAASDVLEFVLARAFGSTSRSKVFLLVPDDLGSWKPEYRELVQSIMPDLIIHHDEGRPVRISGELGYEWMFPGTASGTLFYLRSPDSPDFRGWAVKGASTGATIKPVIGAADRSGYWRVIDICFTHRDYHVVVAPAACFDRLMTHIGIGMTEATFSSAEGLQPAQTPPAPGPLEAMLPNTPQGIAEWDALLGWRSGAINSVAEIACTLDALTPLPNGKKKFKTSQSVAVRTVGGVETGTDISGDALRKIIKRKMKAKGSPEALKLMLSKALEKWKQYFIHS